MATITECLAAYFLGFSPDRLPTNYLSLLTWSMHDGWCLQGMAANTPYYEIPLDLRREAQLTTGIRSIHSNAQARPVQQVGRVLTS